MLFVAYFYYLATQVRGLDPADFGIVMGVYYGATVLAEVPTGVVADRLGRRTALILGAAANTLACVVIAGANGLAAFALGQVAFAVGTALMSGADSALLFDSLGAEDRQSEYPRAEGGLQAAWLLGSAVGMTLTDVFLVGGGDPTPAVWATAGLCAAACLLGFALVEPRRTLSRSSHEITRDALADVFRRPTVLSVVVYSVGVFVLLRLAITIFFNPVLERAGWPLDTWGSVLAAINVLGGLAAWQGPRWQENVGLNAMLWGMPAVLMGMYVGIAWGGSPFVALFALQSIVLGVHPTVVRTLLNRRVSSDAHRATLLSIESLACRLGTTLVSVFAGWSLGVWPLDQAILASAALACLPFLALPWLTRSKR